MLQEPEPNLPTNNGVNGDILEFHPVGKDGKKIEELIDQRKEEDRGEEKRGGERTG